MIKFTNNATTKLKNSITASDVTLEVYTGDGAKFPEVTTASGDYFMITIVSSAGFSEIMKVTNRSGDVLSITRAQEGTTARAFDAGCLVENRWTAGSVEVMLNDTQATTTELGRVTLAQAADMSASSTNKVPTANMCATRTLSNITDQAAARSGIGLGTVATYNVGTGANDIPTNSIVPASVTPSANAIVKSNASSKIDIGWLPSLSTMTDLKWQGSSKTFSTSAPTGGAEGDVWFQYV